MQFFGAIITFIVCHGAPADHFATFVEELRDETIEIYASGPGLKKLQERSIEVQHPFSLDGLSFEQKEELAEKIAKSCENASLVITDLGDPFDIELQKALASRGISRVAYYENPEDYVPGGYSLTAAEVIKNASCVLFANSHLANAPVYEAPGQEIDFVARKKIGLGYYPLENAERLKKLRLEKGVNLSHKTLVYFGGNNEVYFTKALPAFFTLFQEAAEKTDLPNFPIEFYRYFLLWLPDAAAKSM